MVLQLERGENSTPHLQGYVVVKQPKTLVAMKKIHATAHWENRKGSHEQVGGVFLG